jgi:HSP20 family protein
MTLVRKSFEDLMTLPRLVDRLFEEPFMRPSRWFMREYELPAVDVRSTAEDVIVEAALPGLKADDLEITIDGDLLMIKGTFKHDERAEESGYTYRELSRGEFSRSITLPARVCPDDAKAVFKDGLLTLTLPKVVGTKPHKVEVTAG